MPFRLTEDSIIDAMRRRSRGTGPRPVAGIGDDAAVLALPRRTQTLVTTDFLTDGVHVLAGRAPWRLIGRKAMAVNLSDIAAMGGMPHSAVVSLGLPPDTAPRAARELVRGLAEGARRHAVAIVGGDTCAAERLFVSVTLIGAVEPGRAVRRSGGRPGHGLYVTGSLGAAAAGLALLLGPGRGAGRRRGGGGRAGSTRPPWTVQRLRGRSGAAARRRALAAHLDPAPRVVCGRALGVSGLASAMIDLSDGLSRDLPRLCRASGCGAILAESALPVARAALAVLGERGAIRAALTGGEDYELLFAARLEWEALLAVLARRLRLPIARIGQLRPRAEGIRLLTADGRYRPLPMGGFEHFCRS